MPETTTRVGAITNAFRQRANAIAATRDEPEPHPVTDGPPEPPEEAEDQLPKESWKKDDIVDWLLANGIEAERSDLEALTKAELIENFVDEG